MATVSVRAAIKRSVESASNGEQTVIFTAKGQPCVMNIIKKFDMSTIDASMSGTHPAFIVNGKELDRILIGTYEGRVLNGELLSNAYVAPISDTMLNLAAFAKANGKGFHLMSNAEWAMLQMLAVKNGYSPLGNTSFGKSDNDAAADYNGVNVNGYPAGDSRAGTIFTGSGPIQYRLDGKFTGISDLVGNQFEPVLGMRLAGNEIQVIPDNDVAQLDADWGATSAAWRAIDAVTGEYIKPTFTGSFANKDYVATTQKSVRMSYNSTDPYTISTGASGWGVYGPYTGMSNKGTTPVSIAAMNVLKKVGLFPMRDALPGNDGIQIGNAANPDLNGIERLMWRGGFYWDAPNQGLYSAHITYQRTGVNNASGRIAYYDA